MNNIVREILGVPKGTPLTSDPVYRAFNNFKRYHESDMTINAFIEKYAKDYAPGREFNHLTMQWSDHRAVSKIGINVVQGARSKTGKTYLYYAVDLRSAIPGSKVKTFKAYEDARDYRNKTIIDHKIDYHLSPMNEPFALMERYRGLSS